MHASPLDHTVRGGAHPRAIPQPRHACACSLHLGAKRLAPAVNGSIGERRALALAGVELWVTSPLSEISALEVTLYARTKTRARWSIRGGAKDRWVWLLLPVLWVAGSIRGGAKDPNMGLGHEMVPWFGGSLRRRTR